MNLNELLKQGITEQDKQRSEADKLAETSIRGGSIGIKVDGKIYGGCMRKHFLRMLGWQMPVEINTKVMFEAGFKNEDSVAEILKQAPCDVKQEEEYPVNYLPEGGSIRLTGRPDITVFKKGATEPEFGIELKNISSIWTINSVVGKGEPKSDHLVQAGFYSYMLGKQNNMEPLNYKLMYSNSMNWHILYNKYIASNFQGRTHLAEHKYNKKYDTHDVFMIKPGRFVYDMRWDKNSLMYTVEGDTDYQPTCITKEGYDNYIEELEDMYLAHKNGEDRELPPAPMSKHVNGGKSYSICDYCELSPICTSGNKSLTQFTKESIVAIKNKRSELGQIENRIIY